MPPRCDLVRGDCREVLREYPANSFDACITDPPYGLSDHPPAELVLRAWLEDGDFEHGRPGFMGRKWDSFVPGPMTWREVYRVLKPGAYLLAFAGPRSYDFMSMAIRLAGFEIRDQVLNWMYGEGWPKGVDVSKAIDEAAGAVRDRLKQIPITERARQWSGWNTSLKGSQEPIVVARKPLEGNVVENVLAWGTGALHIEACRVQTRPRLTGARKETTTGGGSIYGVQNTDRALAYDAKAPTGRWPTNSVLTHHPDCVHIGTREVRSDGHYPGKRGKGGISSDGHKGQDELAESYTSGETVDVFACVQGCVVRALDDQAGDRRSGGLTAGTVRRRTDSAACYDTMAGVSATNDYRAESGSASRFFPTFYYSPKVAAIERDIGLEAGTNRHVSLKPIALCRWLIRLVVPPGGLMLDTHMGAGSMGCGAALEQVGYVGIELDADNEGWIEIAEKRIAYTRLHPTAFDPEKRTGPPAAAVPGQRSLF